ncbi:Uncharacterised protein [Citrobacter koseri]|uniref:Uncharacterized protein n=1 Tax=Citrobacter koseri TaxID=545 RepID=A0A3S4MAD5_CITKO|nr:Uncharacterised protein [Citrobacter koseri]
MINFMAAMVLSKHQGLSWRKEYSSPYMELHPGAEVYHHHGRPVHIARYLIIALSPLPYQS